LITPPLESIPSRLSPSSSLCVLRVFAALREIPLA
jgi:hypothetical protein